MSEISWVCLVRPTCSLDAQVHDRYAASPRPKLRSKSRLRRCDEQSVLAYVLQVRLGVAQHPGVLGILHFPYYVSGHSFSGLLDSVVVWVLGRRASV